MQIYWLKKVLVISIIALLICLSVIPSINGLQAQKDINKLDKLPRNGFLQGNIVLESSEIPSTIQPELQTVTIEISVDYFVSGLGAKYIVPFLEKRKTAPIELSLDDAPDWCYADISPEVVYQQISTSSGKYPARKSYVTIKVSTIAPAWQSFVIGVKAESLSVKGPLGLITFIRGSKNRLSFMMKPGFYSSFQYEYDTFITLHPNKVKTVPIEITSYSNARTKLHFEIENPPKDWKCSINSELLLGTAVLDEDPTGTVNFNVEYPSKFVYVNEAEQFNIRVRTYAAGHPEAGFDNSTILHITVRCRTKSIPRLFYNINCDN